MGRKVVVCYGHPEDPDAETMHAGLASAEMREAGRDVRNFATRGVTMFTQEEESVHGPVGEV
ncbi:hypothetical protein ABI214_17200 [Prescottella soli]|uniref:Uncharacterized protein n=1 Tax=Prescottella soli TaxID=1543852 RepID=A0ABW9FYW9_9NOCA